MRTADNEIIIDKRLHLQPILRAPAGEIPAVFSFGDDALGQALAR